MKSLAVLSSVAIALVATPAVAKSTHHSRAYIHAPRYGYSYGPAYNRPYNYYAPYWSGTEYAPGFGNSAPEPSPTYVPGFGNIGAGAGPGEDWK